MSLPTLSYLRLSELQAVYRDGLLQDVLPFWLRHGRDCEHGGLFTCLDRQGRVIDTDKAIWLQGRTAWTLSTASLRTGAQAGWLEKAKRCLVFIREHGRSPEGKLYFTVTRERKPLRMRRYVYSESFAAIGCAA